MTSSDILRRAAVVAVLLSGRAAFGQDANGPELAVNTYTTGPQSFAAVAQDGSGHFVVAWSGSGDGDGDGVFARRFTSAGLPFGPEFRVNSNPAGNEAYPALVASRAGEFVVTWTGYGQSSSDYGIFGQRFDAAGTPVGGDFEVNTGTVCCDKRSRMATDGSGSFVVVWTNDSGQDGDGSGVFARRYDAIGGFGPEIPVNVYTTGFQQTPAVAMAGDGSFAVAWAGEGSDDPFGIFVRRFDAAGTPLGGDSLVNEVITGNQLAPSVATAPDGSFVVVWHDAVGDGDGYAVFGRRFDSTGSPIAGQFQVNTYTPLDQKYPQVATDAAGAFMVTWSNYGGSDGDAIGVSERRFDSAGDPVNSEFVVNSYTTGTQILPAIVSGRSGQFVIAWHSQDQDGDGNGIFARRYGDLIFGDSFESGGFSAWSSSSTDGGDLSVSPAAALGSPGLGLQAVVNDTAGIYVQDDAPADEDRYRARFYFDTNGFDPGVAQGHVRTRIFVGFEEAPTRRLFAVVLRLVGGQYALMGRSRRDDNSQADTGFFPISAGTHSVEIDWRRSSGQDEPDGTFEMSIDGTSMATLTALDNGRSSVDFARLGALSIKPGASGTLFYDAFESRRLTAIGQLP